MQGLGGGGGVEVNVLRAQPNVGRCRNISRDVWDARVVDNELFWRSLKDKLLLESNQVIP